MSELRSSDIAQFVQSYTSMAEAVNRYAVDKGWWDKELRDGERRNDAEMIALMHSELSEALEALRHGNQPDDHLPEFSSVEVELADVIIRIMDFSVARGHRVAEAIIAKHAYNQKREYMHGGKKF